MANKNGFTLIELLVVVAIISITLAIGFPSFQSIITNSRLTTAANSMVSALQFARSEALKQHKAVVIRKKTTDWIGGWNMFVDLNANNTQQITTEATIASFDAFGSTITVTSTYANYVNYGANGQVNDNGHFTFNSGTDWRCIIIASTGRLHTLTKETATTAEKNTCT